MANDGIPGPDGVMGAETIGAAPVRKWSAVVQSKE